uniref:Uncharacterized protein n=1 Tax=Romanomermis culicivorax TaxID=13658 RepID=A0A915I4Q4_ROMCU
MDFCELMQIVKWRKDDFQRDNCNSCPPPCIESQYGTTITETKINNWFNSTNEAISNGTIDDLVVANFYLESMSFRFC